MRTKPIGTGPFKFVEFKPTNRSSWCAIPTTGRRACPISTASSSPSSPTARRDPRLRRRQVRHDVPDRRHDPAAEGRQERRRRRRCAWREPTNVSTNLIVNRDAPPFDNPISPRDGAGARPQGVHRHHVRGQADIGGTMLPPPAGVWGMPPEMLETMPGYGPDIESQPREARKLMEKLGLRPGQAARDQGLDPQHRGLPRSRR
jgi:peptide/nickel transport system substrate-binding protein